MGFLVAGSLSQLRKPGMKRGAFLFCVACCAWAATSGARLEAAGPGRLGAPPADLENGRKLFERVWLVGDDQQKTDDGLGPLFNERSCVACHSQGGLGGGGPNEKNVELLSVAVPPEWQWSRNELEDVVRLRLHEVGPGNPLLLELDRRVGLVHNDLRQGSMVLHSFSTDPHYAGQRERVLGLVPTPDRMRPNPPQGELPKLRHADGTDPVKTVPLEGFTLQVSTRNSSAMFGAGVIDRIPDSALRKIAAEQANLHSKVSGRYLGKFGWRGQIARLDSFVFGACDIELGLQLEDPTNLPKPATVAVVSGGSAPKKPVAPSKGPRFDVGLKDTDDLVAFVASLPAPRRKPPVDDAQAAAIKHGEAVFDKVGCADCHRPNIESVQGIYSDLLVHDMGLALADPSGPAASGERPLEIRPEQLQGRVPRTGISYYGKVFRPTASAVALGAPLTLTALGEKFGPRLQEWKTTPLWGLADSAPYLHDGRSPTVEDAIRWHGGESAESAAAYRLLPPTDQADVLTFLSTLVAPPGLKPTAPATP
jgi:CxxC motif-containing protein (DUF1111 family)